MKLVAAIALYAFFFGLPLLCALMNQWNGTRSARWWCPLCRVLKFCYRRLAK
jgi:hypothetical protein